MELRPLRLYQVVSDRTHLLKSPSSESTLALSVGPFTLSASEGKIINAASGDLSFLDYYHFFIIHIVIGPCATILLMVTLYFVIGAISVWCMFLIAGLIGLQVLLGSALSKVKYQTSRHTDARRKLLYDVVSGIRTVKTYGWEIQLLVRRVYISGASRPSGRLR